MAFFETCSDDGKKSTALTEKFTCEICGGIKSCYNVSSARSRSSQDDLVTERSKGEEVEDLLCQCDKETCYQWLKRLVGFGPQKVQIDNKSGISRGWYSTYTEGLKLRLVGTQGDSSSKVSKTLLEDVDVTDSQLVLTPASKSPIPKQTEHHDSSQIDAEGKADVEDHHSQTSKDSKGKRKKKKKGFTPSSFRDSYGSETKVSQTEIKEILQANSDVDLSTATVFHKYRSRVHYSFQPEKRRNLIKKKRAAKTASEIGLQNLLAKKNKQHSAAVDEDLASISEDLARDNCFVNPERLNWGTHCSVYNPARQKKKSKETTLSINFQNFPMSPAVHHSYSNPETDKEYLEALSQLPMSKKFSFNIQLKKLPPPCLSRRKWFSRLCSSPKLLSPRAHSLSARAIRKKSPSLNPFCHPNPYPMILSSVAPSLRKSARDLQDLDPFSETREKPGSCPCTYLSPKPLGREITSDTLHAKRWGGKPASGRSKSDQSKSGRMCWVSGNGPCSLTVPRPKFNSISNFKHVQQNVNTDPYKMDFKQGKVGNPKTEYNEKGFLRTQRNKEKLIELLKCYSYKEQPRLSRSPVCISRFIESQQCSNRGGDNVDKVSTAVQRGMHYPGLSPCKRLSHPLNFSQSSSYGRSPDSTVCSKCQNVIELNETASERECKCEFVLAPHCIRRKGPRSTVNEYLSTIDPPKPRPRVKSVTSQQVPAGQEETNTTVKTKSPSIRSSKGSSVSNKGSGKFSKTKKGKDSAVYPSEIHQWSAHVQANSKASTSRGATRFSSEVTMIPHSQQPSKAGKSDAGKRDDNNNYGVDVFPAKSNFYSFEEYTNNTTPSRAASVPAQNYISHLDTGYARTNVSPYFTSNGMRTAHVGSSYSPRNSGYFRAAQDFRKSIRNYYEQKRLFYERAAGDVKNLHTWRPEKSMSLASSGKLEKKSEKTVPRRRNSSLPSKKKYFTENYKKSQTPAESTASKEKTSRDQVRQQSPRLATRMPSYFPRKSFLEGASPINFVDQDHWKAEQILDKNVSKSQLVGKEAEMENVAVTAIGHVEKMPPDKNKEEKVTDCFVEQEIIEEETDCVSEKDETNCVSVKYNEEKQKDIDRERVTETSAILNGMESSVDLEPSKSGITANKLHQLLSSSSTVKKIEPRRAFFKAQGSEANQVSTADHKVIASDFLSCLFSSTTPSLASAGPQKTIQKNPHAQPDGAAPVPVFQNLLERFSESVQIFVRTRENTKETDQTMQGEAKVVAKGTGCGHVTDMCDMTAVAKEKCVASWGTENMSRNKTDPSCENTSECISWSDMTNTRQTCEANTIPTLSVAMKNASTASSSATVVPALSLASLRAAGGDPALHLNPTLENRDYEMKMEISTTTERVYVEHSAGNLVKEKPGRDIMASVSQAVFSSKRVMKDIVNLQDTSVDLGWFSAKHGSATHVLAAASPVFVKDGEVGQGEDLSNRLALSPSLRKSCSLVDPKWARINIRDMGSSVDPIPDSSSPVATRSILDAIKGGHPMFHKVNDDCDAAMIMSAKSRFLKKIKGESITTIHPGKNYVVGVGLPNTIMAYSLTNVSSRPIVHSREPFLPTSCRSLDSAASADPEQRTPIQIVLLTEAMKKFISIHGTPV